MKNFQGLESKEIQLYMRQNLYNLKCTLMYPSRKKTHPVMHLHPQTVQQTNRMITMNFREHFLKVFKLWVIHNEI